MKKLKVMPNNTLQMGKVEKAVMNMVEKVFLLGCWKYEF
jgi:hypothetical protein